MSETKVIGYFAYKSRAERCCDGEALVVVGSHDSMKRIRAQSGVLDSALYTIKKARFREVIEGIKRGGAYAFDKEAYERFSTAAKETGIPCADHDFSTSNAEEIKLVTISNR